VPPRPRRALRVQGAGSPDGPSARAGTEAVAAHDVQAAGSVRNWTSTRLTVDDLKGPEGRSGAPRRSRGPTAARAHGSGTALRCAGGRESGQRREPARPRRRRGSGGPGTPGRHRYPRRAGRRPSLLVAVDGPVPPCVGVTSDGSRSGGPVLPARQHPHPRRPPSPRAPAPPSTAPVHRAGSRVPVPWLPAAGRGRQEAVARRDRERAGRSGFAGGGAFFVRRPSKSPCRSASTTYGHPLPGELLSNHPHPHLFALRTVEALHKAWRAGWSPSPRSPSTPESRRAR
jgi:hypothetical protein